jgi:hypothetical protein
VGKASISENGKTDQMTYHPAAKSIYPLTIAEPHVLIVGNMVKVQKMTLPYARKYVDYSRWEI